MQRLIIDLAQVNRSREQLGAAGRRLSPVPGHVQAVKNGLDSAIGARRGIHSRLSQAAADASRITERIARLESFVLQSVQRYDAAERQLISRAAAVEELAGRSVNEAAFRPVDWDEVDVRVQLLAKKLGGLLPQIAGLIDDAEEHAAENLQQLIAASAQILAAITEFVMERLSLVVLNFRDSQPKPVNIANLNLLIAAYCSERKKLVNVDQLFSGNKLDADMLDFLAYVAQKGFHPVTFEGLPYWDWHIAAEKLKEIQDANAAEPRFWGIDLAEGLYEGGKSGVMGIASFGYDLYDDPWGTAKAIGEGAKQISVDIYNETNKLIDDPLLYVNNKAIDLLTMGEEFMALSSNERARLFGEALGRELIYTAAGGMAFKGARGFMSVAGKAGTRLDDVSIQIRQGAVMLVDNAKLAGQRLADPGWLRPLNIAPAGGPGMPDVRLMDGGKQELPPKKNAVQENYLRAMDEKAAGTGKVGIKLTEPSLPNGGKPKGNYTKGDSHGVKKENETADIFADQGYHIKMLDELNGGNGYGIKESSNPDFLIEGEVFDCYAPTIDANSDNILRNIRTKTKTQAERIVLNLDGFTSEKITEITEGILRKANPNGDLKNLQELLIVTDGKITRAFGG